MTTDYTSLDKAIVKAIRDGFDTFFDIEVRTPLGCDYPPNLIGSRLQSLRKRGIIEYTNGRWSAVESVK